ncbi:type IV secretion system protein VirB10 [Phyllobacterium bourgognense]|uniref:Type IV secretion system protein VirB10 n=1 Tax=Phyllobacterium bourgognense TaxID=314236 RepID=A0A368YRG3_9HYPH|nr:type IV secretion system protein VirB10 [Phyllobacterium bourgognense]RCW82783.1 type IV secretion system protein VirB10 [Phyllobacterium bourgognense]
MPDPDYHLNVEVEEAARSKLAEPKRGLSKAALILLFALVCLPLLAMPFWLQRPSTPDNVDTSDENLLSPVGKVQLAVPPPVKELPTTPEPMPAAEPSRAEADAAAERARLQANEEARRMAEAERLARESETDEKKWERYRSPMVVTETGQTEGLAAEQPKPPTDAEKAAATFQDANPNGQFLSAMATKPVEVAKAERTKRIDALVPQGTMIRGVLETAVQTDLPGMVRAVTTEDIWSFDGRRILIPAASRMIGEYNAGVAQGQTRAFIVWTRLMRADGVSMNLGSIGTDELGRSGSAGNVNNHYLKRFGAAGVLSIISAGTQLIAASGGGTRNRTYYGGPIQTTTTDPTTGKVTVNTIYPDDNNAGNDLAMQGAALAVQNFTQLAQEALKAQINIPPTITIDQGTPVSIFVRRDLDFSDLYPDPVMQKLKELKKGRGWDTGEGTQPVYKGGTP